MCARSCQRVVFQLQLRCALGWWRGLAVSDSINEVTLRRAGLVLGWAIACGQVKPFRYLTSHLG